MILIRIVTQYCRSVRPPPHYHYYHGLSPFPGAQISSATPLLTFDVLLLLLLLHMIVINGMIITMTIKYAFLLQFLINSHHQIF